MFKFSLAKFTCVLGFERDIGVRADLQVWILKTNEGLVPESTASD